LRPAAALAFRLEVRVPTVGAAAAAAAAAVAAAAAAVALAVALAAAEAGAKQAAEEAAAEEAAAEEVTVEAAADELAAPGALGASGLEYPSADRCNECSNGGSGAATNVADPAAAPLAAAAAAAEAALSEALVAVAATVEAAALETALPSKALPLEVGEGAAGGAAGTVTRSVVTVAMRCSSVAQSRWREERVSSDAKRGLPWSAELSIGARRASQSLTCGKRVERRGERVHAAVASRGGPRSVSP
jgi:hypothetical protein